MRHPCSAMSVPLAMLLALGACAPPGTVPSPPPSRDILTSAELMTVQESMALDEVVRRHRPEFLRTHRGRPLVFLDNVLLGEVVTLSTLRAGGVAAVQYFSGVDATRRFGLQVEGRPVLQVLSGPLPRRPRD